MKFLRNICLVDTPYALALYLLMMPMEEIERTKFITSSILDRQITEKLPNKCLNYYGFNIGNDWKKLLKVRLLRFYEYPSIFWSKVYAQDHLRISAQVIGKKNYTLIADGPYFLYNYSNCPRPAFDMVSPRSIIGKIKYSLAFGRTIFNKEYGQNQQCANRWLTTAIDAETYFVANRKYTLVDLSALWEKASKLKKTYILTIFFFFLELIDYAKQADVMILTQPFREDCGLTDEEYIEIYKPYIQNSKKVVIKPHPRDKFDFDKYFPTIPVLRTYIPMQLLNFMGVMPHIAVTVNSTAISSLPNNVEKIMIGTKVNKKIFDRYGDMFNDK